MGKIKNFFINPNEYLIWAYPENLVEIRLLVEAVDELCGTGRQGRAGQGTGRDSIDNLSLGLWLLAWLGSALAEVCQQAQLSSDKPQGACGFWFRLTIKIW